MDTSWSLQWSGTSLLLDPWLIGPEIDGFAWFNKQYHATDPVPLEQLPGYDFILISQSYADHCHLETLRALEPKPVLATPKAHSRLQKHMPSLALQKLPDLSQEAPLEIGDLKIGYLAPDRLIDPIYYAIVVAREDRALFYASHGFALLPQHLPAIEKLQFDVLITTFTHFKLPGFLGGLVNPGMPNARQLLSQLQPRHIINTHDEEKQGTGLVSRLARIIYPDIAALHEDATLPFVPMQDYQPREFSSA